MKVTRENYGAMCVKIGRMRAMHYKTQSDADCTASLMKFHAMLMIEEGWRVERVLEYVELEYDNAMERSKGKAA